MAAAPSTMAAFGAANGRSSENPGERASVPMVAAVATPGMARNEFMRFSGFHDRPYRLRCGISAGTPSSHADSRWTSAVSATTTAAGPNGRVPAVHSWRAPDA